MKFSSGHSGWDGQFASESLSRNGGADDGRLGSIAGALEGGDEKSAVAAYRTLGDMTSM
jgi:hypothetical protein